MDSYTPTEGQIAYVHCDADTTIETFVRSYNEGTPLGNATFVAFEGDPGEQLAIRDSGGEWRLSESGQRVTFSAAPASKSGPNVGDICTRIVPGASLMYRIRGFEQYEDLRIAQLTLTPDVLGFRPHAQVSYLPGEGWRWENGDPCTFTSGHTDDLARKAVRLDTLHAALRLKYFYYESMAGTTSRNSVASAIRDEYVEQLFLAETGLMADEEPAKFQEFSEDLRDEYLASIEK